MEAILQELAKLLGVAAGAAVLLVAQKAMAWLNSKGLAVDEARAQAVADRAVAAVEQKAMSLAKAKGASIASSEEKLGSAIAKILDKVPGIDEQEAEDLAEAAVFRMEAALARLLKEARE